MTKVLTLMAGILVFGAAVLAQTGPGSEKSPTVFTERVLTGDQTNAPPIFLLHEMEGLGKVVKGAPYTANAVTETTQVLGDGNRIVNKTSAFLARDSEGRTRREESFTRVGGLQANPFKTVMINDPVAHVQYMSSPKSGSGGEGMVLSTTELNGNKMQQYKIERGESKERLPLSGNLGNIYVRRSGSPLEGGEEPAAGNVNRESLGTQMIEGVSAEGARITKTIPAGAIGNEKAIVITSETWTSPELQVVVLSKRSDPRFGETVYKLTNITRAEPDASLFQLPNDAKKELF